MARINLREYYPFYEKDTYIEAPDEVANELRQGKRSDQTYQRKRRYRPHYSLDRGDGLEREMRFVAASPDEHFEWRLTYEQLHAALSCLPFKQAARIYSHYFLGLKKAEIARSEGVAVNAVKDSITRGLKNLEKQFKKNM